MHAVSKKDSHKEKNPIYTFGPDSEGRNADVTDSVVVMTQGVGDEAALRQHGIMSHG